MKSHYVPSISKIPKENENEGKRNEEAKSSQSNKKTNKPSVKDKSTKEEIKTITNVWFVGIYKLFKDLNFLKDDDDQKPIKET